MGNNMKRLVAFAGLLVLASSAWPQTTPGKFAWTDSHERIKSSQAVSALGPNFAGDQVSLSNGALSFSVTDVSLPGNDGLPVAFTRTYTVRDRKDALTDGMLGDWEVDIPNISGSFTTDWIVQGAIPGNRCSNTGRPPLPGPSDFWYSDYWRGLTIDLPGTGSQELLVAASGIVKPTAGGPYPWVTEDGRTHVACLSGIQNGTGQGFIATMPDGTRIWFDRMAQYFESELTGKRLDPSGWLFEAPAFASQIVRRNVLYATRVEDRFGNYVTYTYSNAWNQPIRLTGIQASDGRQLAIGYSGGHISTVSDGTRTWAYAYTNLSGGEGLPSGRRTLSSVTLPDATAWIIGFSQFTNAWIKYNQAAFNEPLRSCFLVETPLNYTLEPMGTVTHPSGAIGTFTVDIREHGRSNVPINCENVAFNPSAAGVPYGSANNTNDDINLHSISSNSFTFKRKQVSGVGLTTAQWNYSYEPGISRVFKNGATRFHPVCNYNVYSVEQCAEPPKCGTPAVNPCEGSSKTTVVGPNGQWERYTYGNSYRHNEGKLLRIEKGVGPGNILETVENSYDFSLVDQAYPAIFGGSLKVRYEGFSSNLHRPLLSSQTELQGVTFTRTSQAFNSLAQPTRVKRENTLGHHKTEDYDYEHNLSKWVVEQVKSVKCVSSSQAGCTGQFTVVVDYDATHAVPLTHTEHGKLQQTLAWNTTASVASGQRGTVSTVKDGNNNVTTLANWKRGIPQAITFADSTGQSAVVNDLGWITSVNDALNSRNCYAYDSMGRITTVTYTAEAAANTCNTTAWAATTSSFAKSASAKYGLPAGHWQQTVATGAGRKIVYFDAMWRPVVQESFDNTNGTTADATRSISVTRYDASGRQVFQSYPMASLSNYAATALTGTHATYDTLDRAIQSAQDWEGAGQLLTTTEYLANFQTRVTNPRSHQTTTSYLAWDEPAADFPVLVAHPAGAYTHIVRDAFGKPTRIRRSNNASPTGGTVAINRDYTYNVNQELCRSVEPETGATLMGYDAAGNLTWSASGLPAGTACHATGNHATINPVKATRIYDARNRVLSLTFADGQGSQTWTYTADGLPATITAPYDSAGRRVLNSYSYNRRRLLSREQQALTNWGAFYVDHAYNANGHLSGMTYRPEFNIPAIDYAPNALGQPTKAGTYAAGVSYFPNGALKQFTYGNGIVHTLTQNARGLPDTSCDFVGSCNASAILNDGYDYDQNGNVAAISDGRTGGHGNRTMTYDALDRLTQAVSPMFGTATYAYDVLDNLTRTHVTAGANPRNHYYCYSANWQLANVKTGSCSGATVIGLSYDTQGNLSNKNGQAYQFDLGNRLRAVPSREVIHAYDGHGRRVLSTRYVNGSGSLRSIYDLSGRLLFQEDQGEAKRKDYIYLGGNLIAERSLPNTGATTPVSVRYQHTDSLGSPIAVSNEAGVEVERTNYEPYGNVASRSGNPNPRNGIGYTGHVEDAATGLVYMQQRYYDPQLGVFLSVDPVTAYQKPIVNFNRYRYANSNPYRFIDPDGRDGADRRYGNAVGFMLRNDPEALRVWAAGEAAATTQGSSAEQGAAEGVAVGEFVDNGDYSISSVVTATFKAILFGATHRRVTLRKNTREQIEQRQPRNSEGQMVDPNTGQPLRPGEVDVGHKPGNEWRKRKADHEASGSTRQEVIETENNPDLYQLEDRSNNRSRRFEDP